MNWSEMGAGPVRVLHETKHTKKKKKRLLGQSEDGEFGAVHACSRRLF